MTNAKRYIISHAESEEFWEAQGDANEVPDRILRILRILRETDKDPSFRRVFIS